MAIVVVRGGQNLDFHRSRLSAHGRLPCEIGPRLYKPRGS
jgi:hypothetical protein